MPFNDSTNQYSVSRYIVDATGGTPYITVQSAIDAANAAATPAAVYIRPGTYTENLTLYSGIDIVGENEQATTIVGTHTPPASGTLNLFRCAFQSATDIFSSAAAGTTDIIMEDCSVNVTNGYTFNLLNWTGIIEIFDIGNIGTNDGFLNNTGGAPFFAFAAGFGNGTANTMNISGPFTITTSESGCPINFQGTSSGVFSNGTLGGNVTTSNTSTLSISSSSVVTGANQAITHNSSNALTLSEVIIDSSNNPPIGGAGPINYGSVSYPETEAFLIHSGTTAQRPPTGVNGMIRYNSDNNELEGYENTSWMPFGQVVQTLYTSTSAYIDCSALIPYDNTIPQQTEGTQILSQAITPLNANNLLYIIATVNGYTRDVAVNNISTIALFRDATANSLSAIPVNRAENIAAGGVNTGILIHRLTAGSTASTTFKIRGGQNIAGGEFDVNGFNGGQRYGGVAATTLTIYEVKP